MNRPRWRHRVGNELNPILLAAITEVPVEAHDELDVLTDRVGSPASDSLDERAPEEAERARDDQQRTEAAPSHPADEERPEVLPDLQRRERAAWEPDLDDTTVVDTAAIRDPDNAARGRDHGWIVEYRLRD